MFVPIIEKSTFDGIGMPYNLLAFTADSDGNPREPLVIDVGSNSEYFGNKYIVPTFDEMGLAVWRPQGRGFVIVFRIGFEADDGVDTQIKLKL